MRVRVKYSKQGLMKFIGHLDMMRYFQKALRRAGIDVVYTEGLSPHMSMSFALPLGVGMTSDSEYVDVDLVRDLPGSEIVRRLNISAPEGIHFTDARRIQTGKAHKGMTLAARADYTLRLKRPVRAVSCASGILMEDTWTISWKQEFLDWLKQPQILVMKKGKKTEKEIDIRPLIYEAYFTGPDAAQGEESQGGDLHLGLGAGLDRNIRPELVMQAFAEQTGRTYDPFLFEINRDEVYADKGNDAAHDFISLIDLGEIIAGDNPASGAFGG
jgi:radical SAM-linked protein